MSLSQGRTDRFVAGVTNLRCLVQTSFFQPIYHSCFFSNFLSQLAKKYHFPEKFDFDLRPRSTNTESQDKPLCQMSRSKIISFEHTDTQHTDCSTRPQTNRSV